MANIQYKVTIFFQQKLNSLLLLSRRKLIMQLSFRKYKNVPLCCMTDCSLLTLYHFITFITMQDSVKC